MSAGPITIETTVNAPISRVWDCWTLLEHISQWAFASEGWGAAAKVNDLRVGGVFVTEMFASDGSTGFDFGGVYTAVDPHERIEYDLGDGRHVRILFSETPAGVRIVQSFDPEDENPRDYQQAGWQAILDNFRAYTEAA